MKEIYYIVVILLILGVVPIIRVATPMTSVVIIISILVLGPTLTYFSAKIYDWWLFKRARRSRMKSRIRGAR